MSRGTEEDDPVEALRDALRGIRGVCLTAGKKREQLVLINEIVGEALYGDFAGTLEQARADGRILP